MTIIELLALDQVARQQHTSEHYGSEAATVNYVRFLLSIISKYMEESEERSESLTAAFIDSLGEILFLLTELEEDLCKSEDN